MTPDLNQYGTIRVYHMHLNFLLSIPFDLQNQIIFDKGCYILKLLTN